MQPQKAKAPENEAKAKKEEVAINGELQVSLKTAECCCLLACDEEISSMCHSSVGEVRPEGNSLMEQLRGEALKFHKPGEPLLLDYL